MFDFVRQHKRIMQLLLVILIFPSFVLFGVDGYQRFNQGGPVVAEVGDQTIHQDELEQVKRQQGDRIRQQNPNLDPKLFDSAAFERQVLENMVNERVVQLAAQQSLLTVSDEQLARFLATSPELQAIRKPDGSVDMKQYQAMLASQGLSPQGFEAKTRADLVVDQVLQTVMLSDLGEGLRSAHQAWMQQRNIQWTRIDPQSFAGQIQPTEAVLKAQYDKQQSRLKTEEALDGEWVAFSADDLMGQVSLKAEDVRAYYDQNQKLYGTLEQRRARHVLIAVAQNAQGDALKQAQTKAEAVLKTVQANPKSFPQVAQKQSEDPGSAQQGGDLGWFGQADMVKPFADAAFGLKKDEISGLVRSSFGFHIIQVLDIKPGSVKSFESVRPSIEAQLKRQLAQQAFAEAAEQFTNMVYEQSDSLDPVIKKFNLKRQTFKGMTRQTLQGLPPELLNPKVREALFDAQTIKLQRNTSAVEVKSSQLVSARVTQHHPARVLTFEEARAAVTQSVKTEQSLVMAKDTANELLGQVKAGQGKLKQSAWVSRMNRHQLPEGLIEAVMKVPSSGSLPARLVVDQGAQGVFVVQVDAVQTPKPDALDGVQQGLLKRIYSASQAQAYLDALKKRFKVRIHEDRLQKAVPPPVVG
jgi:peptidyl-prolyl cis-trans isomerase D